MLALAIMTGVIDERQSKSTDDNRQGMGTSLSPSKEMTRRKVGHVVSGACNADSVNN